jgi:hypothetical protein
MRKTLLVAALALAASACGGEDAAPPPRPTLAPPVADRLAAQSEAIAEALDAGDVCTAAVRADELQDETLRAINAGQVPPAFQEDLTSRVNELVNTVNCVRTDDDEDEEDKKDEKDEKDDEGEGKGKDKKKDKKNDDEPEPVVTLPLPTETGE